MDLYLSYMQGLATGRKIMNPASEAVFQRLLVSRYMLGDDGDQAIVFNMARDLLALGLVGEAYNAYGKLDGDLKRGLAPLFGSLIDLNDRTKLDLTVEIITKCNVRCPLCVHGGGRYYDKTHRTMPLGDFKTIWDKVRGHVGLAILVGMGESFLHPDFYDIVEYIGDVPIHLDTNGNVKGDWPRLFGASVSTLVFSIDGTDQRNYEKYRVGGDWGAAVENLRRAVAAKRELGRGPKIIFKYISFKHNEMHVDKARELATGLGVDGFQVNECNLSTQSPPETARRFVPCGAKAVTRIKRLDYGNNLVVPTEQFDSPYCSTPLTKPYVQVDGVVQPCCAAYKPGFFKKCADAADEELKSVWDSRLNLLDRSLEEIWRDPLMRDFRIGALTDRHKMDSCRYCLMPTCSVDHVLMDTVLESENSYPPSDDVLEIGKLKIDSQYLQYLIKENLTEEISYYEASNALSEDAQAILRHSSSNYSH